MIGKTGTCQHCKRRQPLNDNGYVAYHPYPPTAGDQICRGSNNASVEAIERARPLLAALSTLDKDNE